MILLLVRCFLGASVKPALLLSTLGSMTVLSARDAREMEGDRVRSMGLREVDITDAGREGPPSLTPPPRTVTLPLS